jgi:YtkA-like
MRTRDWVVGPWMVALVLGCGSSSGGPGNTTPDAGDLITCQNDPRAMTYASGLSVTSTSGTRKYVLLSANPAPPARGTDTWSIKITDAGGTAQPGLTVGVLPFMPDHGHGTSVNASVTANQDGTYTVAPLYFFMPGVWRITFWIGSNQADVGEFFFCVPG